MYRELTVKTPGCVAFSFPVQRRNLRIFEDSSVFPTLHSQRSARLTRSGGFEPERRRSQVTILFQGRLQTRQNRLLGRRARYANGRRALWRRAGPSATDKAALFAAKMFRRADA